MKTFKNQRGQALVEFAIVVPILMIILMAILEFGLMLNSYLIVSNASREGSRYAALGGSDLQVSQLVLQVTPTLSPEDLTVTISPSQSNRYRGDSVGVTVGYNYHVQIPLISNIISDGIHMESTTHMRVE